MEEEERGWEQLGGIQEDFIEGPWEGNREFLLPSRARMKRVREAHEEAEREGEGIGKYDSSDYTRECENILQL